jgi:hypothetical protein
MHAGGVVPTEKGRICPHLPLHEVDGRGRGLIVDRFHALAGKRTGIFDGLLADAAPARLFGSGRRDRRTCSAARRADQILPKLNVAGIKPVLRILLGVEVIKIAVKFIEAVHRRQIFVAIAEVVLAKLTGGVAERF